MGLFTQSVRKFTSAESFQLFMEGLRSLQLYEEMASESSPENPTSRKELDARLANAASNLSECVAKYQRDLLPQYYYAIVLSTQGQRTEAVQLQSYLANSAMPPWPSEHAEQLYRESAAEFRKVVGQSHGDVNKFARYNLAQVLAKISSPIGWDDALKLLYTVRSEYRGFRQLSGGILANLFDPLIETISSLLLTFRTTPEAPCRIAAAATASAERNAFDAQVQMLMGFIEARQAARNQGLRISFFPLPPVTASERLTTLSEESKQRIKNFRDARNASERYENPSAVLRRPRHDSKVTLSSFLSKLDEVELPTQAKSDLRADYWNKWSRVALESAVFGNQPNEESAKLIDLASDYAQTAIQLKGSTWTPALLNSALARTLAGGEAGALVTAIVGHEAVVQVAGVTKTADPDQIAQYILAMPLGTPAKTIANLVLRAFGKLDAETLQKLVRTLDHAKLKMELIDEITESLSNQ